MRLKDEFRNTIVIQKSRFITCICPCRTEEEARSYIAAIRKEFPDATHVCTAYSVGDTIRRSSDNKEPAGTAGVPMLVTPAGMVSDLRAQPEKACPPIAVTVSGISTEERFEKSRKDPEPISV